MKVGIIVQARMNSTRLPGKVMMLVNEKDPVIKSVITQLQFSKLSEKIVIATTTLSEDDKIKEFLEKINIDCFRGSSEDCLDRYYQCAKRHSFSIIVRITCDNPLIDPNIVDASIEKFKSNSWDYVSNCHPRTFPQGTEVEVFSFQALEKAWNEARKSSEREHVTPYFYNNPSKFKIYNLNHSENLSHLRWTIDRINDLKMVQAIYSKVKKSPILMNDILELFKKEPQLVNINKDHIINEGYLKSLKTDEIYKFKN